eukprot:7228311-Prymnesium_polylepis.1
MPMRQDSRLLHDSLLNYTTERCTYLAYLRHLRRRHVELLHDLIRLLLHAPRGQGSARSPSRGPPPCPDPPTDAGP